MSFSFYSEMKKVASDAAMQASLNEKKRRLSGTAQTALLCNFASAAPFLRKRAQRVLQNSAGRLPI